MALLIDEYGDVTNDDSYSGRHRGLKLSSKSILPDMQDIDLSDGIKNEAEQVYSKMGSPVRKDKERKIMVFCCILYAHVELNIIHSPKELARKVGVDDSKIPSYVNRYSMKNVGYHPPQRFYSVSEYVESLMDKVGFDQRYRQVVIQCAKKIDQSSLTDGNIQPDIVAAGIILYNCRNIMDNAYHSTYLQRLKQLIICNDRAFSDMEKKVCQYDNSSM